MRPSLTNNYVIREWLVRNSTAVLYGPSGSRKTFMALDIGLHVAAGARHWHGVPITNDGHPVLYIAAEGSAGLANRVLAWATEHPDLWPAASERFIALPAALDFVRGHDAVEVIKAVEGVLTLPPCLITVDTVARVMPGSDENAPADMSMLVRNADVLRAATGACVLLIHHPGKDVSRGARGHSSLKAALETEIEVVADGGVSTATVMKQRDGPTGASLTFGLTLVRMGHDETGEMVTSCVVAPAAGRATNRPAAPTGDRLKYLEAMREYAADHGEPNPGGTGWPEPGRVRTICNEAFIEWASGKSGAERPRDRRKAVTTAIQKLIQDGFVRMNDRRLWICPR